MLVCSSGCPPTPPERGPKTTLTVTDLRAGRAFRAIPAALLLFLTSSLWSQADRSGEAVIARAGNVFITEKEFIERFELLPGLYRHRLPQLPTAKLEFLYSLIAEKLLVQEAAARNLDRDSAYLSALNAMRRLLSRDELYRQEVKARVHLSGHEIAEGCARARRQVLVSFLYTRDSTGAAFLRSRIRTARDFETMQFDSTLDVTSDTATVILGDAEQAIEDWAYRLRRQEISPVIRAGDGYYIIRVETVQPNTYFGGLDPTVLRERVEDLLRTRKEKERLAEFTSAFLRDRTGYSRPGAFNILARALDDLFRRRTPSQGRIPFTEEMAEQLRHRCGQSLRDTLVDFGTSAWSMEEVIDRLLRNGFSVDSLSAASVPALLNDQLRIWVRQELLADEAIRRSLDTTKDVREQMELWADAYRSDMMRDYIRERLSIPDSAVWSYLRSSDTALHVPEVQIRRLTTASLEEMQGAMKEIERGTAFASVISRWSVDSAERRRGGLGDFFPVTEHQPIGEIASQMEIGQRFGPVREQNSYVLFDLVAKRTRNGGRDTAFAAKWGRASRELMAEKVKETVSLLVAQAAQRRGFDVYEDRLNAIKVTPIPMMTYRILGFGGRIPAVPFVPREIEWLNVEPPSTQVVP